MLRTRPSRGHKWTEIPDSSRLLVSRKRCRICNAFYGKLVERDGKVFLAKQVLHHLIARRFLEERGIDAHRPGNLYSICSNCHGRTQGFEEALFRGDLLTFLQGSKRIGLPVEKIVQFALSVGLKEFQGLFK